jgi:hypothetical protein
MANNRSRPTNRYNLVFSGILLVLICCIAAPGCNRSGGLSEFERAQKKKDDAAGAIRAMGGEVTTVNYPAYGDGWAVKLRAAQITDDVFKHMKTLKRVSELDLSKSNITDAQLARLSEQDVGNMIVKLDLSQTAITDAGVDNLKLPLLTQFTVTGTKISDAAVDRLKQSRASDPRLPAFRLVR